MGMRTGLLSMDAAAIGRMSCNPAIGGTAKGHLVNEIAEILTEAGIEIKVKALVICTGTFLNAVMHTGLENRIGAAMKSPHQMHSPIFSRHGDSKQGA